MSARDHHPPCPGGCGELADECMTPGCGSPLGSMRIAPPVGSSALTCNGLCVRAFEILPGYGSQIAIPHPDCDLHGDAS